MLWYYENEVIIALLLPVLSLLLIAALLPKNKINKLFADYFSYKKPKKFGFLQQYIKLPLPLFIWSILSTLVLFYFFQQPFIAFWSKDKFILAVLPTIYFIWMLIATNVVSFITGEKHFKRPIIVTTSQMYFIIVLIISIGAVFQLAYPTSMDTLRTSAIILVFLLVLQRLIKSVWVCLSNQISLYYLILYLCALEIAPLLFIYRKIAVFESD